MLQQLLAWSSGDEVGVWTTDPHIFKSQGVVQFLVCNKLKKIKEKEKCVMSNVR